MSPSGETMRRSFNPDLLPKVPPKKEEPKGCRNTNRRFPEIRNFFDLYISLSRGKYVRKEMAEACVCSTQSVSHWKHGTPPGRQAHRHISRYFAKITGISAPLILSDLEYAYHTGFQRWYAEEKQKQKQKQETE